MRDPSIYRQLSATAAIAAVVTGYFGLFPVAVFLAGVAIAGVLIEGVPALLRSVRERAYAEDDGIQVTSFDVHRIRYTRRDGELWVSAEDFLGVLGADDIEPMVRRLDATECDRVAGDSSRWLSARGVHGLLDKRTDREARRLLVWYERVLSRGR